MRPNNTAALLALSALLISCLPEAAIAAAPGAALGGFLSAYVPNSIISNSTYANATLGGSSYAIVQLPGGANMIVNTTGGGYSFVLGASTAFSVLAPYLVNKYYPNASTLASLNSTMRSFQGSSAKGMNDCLQETGLINQLCTSSASLTQCLQQSCQTVPVCTQVLNGVGPSSPFAYGIRNLSLRYLALNGNYSRFYSTLGGLSRANAATALQALQSIAATIASLSAKLPQNPVLPPPSNLSIQQQSTICSSYGASGGPWFCYAVGFCLPITFNTPAIASVQAQLNTVLLQPISNQSISALAGAAVASAKSYYLPAVNRTQSLAFNAFVANLTPRYAALVANITVVNSGYSNAILSTQLAALQGVYSSIKNGPPSQNLTAANATLSAAEANALSAYTRVAPVYLAAYSLALNNTALILAKELDYRQQGYAEADILALREAKINSQLSGQVNSSQLAALQLQLQAVRASALAISTPVSAGAVLKAAYGGLLAALLYSPTAPAATLISEAPAYAGAVTMFFCAMLVVVIYLLTYFRLSRKKKLNLNPRVKRAWTFLFIAMLLLAALASVAVYMVANGANQFLPAESFTAALASSPNAYIMVSSSLASNSSVQQCVGSIGTAKGKTTFYRLNYTAGYSCTISNAISGNACINRLLGSSVPIILITNSTNSSIAYKGMYGTTLYASGSVVEGASCALGSILKVG